MSYKLYAFTEKYNISFTTANKPKFCVHLLEHALAMFNVVVHDKHDIHVHLLIVKVQSGRVAML